MAAWMKSVENGRLVYILKGTYIDVRRFDRGYRQTDEPCYAVFKNGVMTDGGPYKRLSSAKKAGVMAWENRNKGK